jgi:hypothetical protein
MLFDADTAIVLVTRYSLRERRIMKMARIQDEAMRIEWFRLRSLLFKEITLSSMMAQSLRPMRWYLLLAEGDQALLEEHVPALPEWVKPLYLQDDESVTPQFYADILDEFGWAKNLVISRLDNDDALHSDYFKSVNDEMDWSKTRSDCYLIQERGCRWDGHRIQSFKYSTSPFLTVVSSDWKKTQPSPLVDHRKVLRYKHAFLRGVADETMWMQSVHGLNASNAFRADFGGVTEVDIEYISRRFGVSDGAVRAIALNTPMA